MTMTGNMIGKLLVILCFLHYICALPEQGAYEVQMNMLKTIAVFTKSMHKDTNINVKVLCSSPGTEALSVKVEWLLRWTPCAEEYIGIDENTGGTIATAYLKNPGGDLKGFNYNTVKYIQHEMIYQCGINGQELPLMLDAVPVTERKYINLGNITAAVVQNKKKDLDSEEPQTDPAAEKSRRRRQVDPPISSAPAVPVDPAVPAVPAAPAVPEAQPSVTPTYPPTSTVDYLAVSTYAPPYGFRFPDLSLFNSRDDQALDQEEHVVTQTWETGVYVFIVRITPVNNTQKTTFNATVDVRMKGPYGYLSAIEWPLLPFYGAMCVFYVIFGLGWLVLSFCNWRDLLRIQFWIGGVIFLGMLEKAVFFAEYESINTTGVSVKGAIVIAELVSCLKRTLSRMLVIIVSLGFGIVKPRLGPMLHRVLAMGGLYFILSSVEGCLRVLKTKSDQSSQMLLATIPLAVLDAAICWWIFTALVTTTRTLRLRRNLIKLSLYRHFTNTLIFAVLASVAFMIWSITQHRLAKCLKDWRELWVDDAFWHLLFSVILVVIMVLWRPNANNQRYAFSPLLDVADEEAGEPMINDAFDGMKIRSKDGDKPRKDSKSKADDDMKWIEDNIPTSVTDTALPSLLDSDEEIMNTKYEMSKME